MSQPKTLRERALSTVQVQPCPWPRAGRDHAGRTTLADSMWLGRGGSIGDRFSLVLVREASLAGNTQAAANPELFY